MGSKADSPCNESVFRKLFRLHAEDLHRFIYYKYGAENNPEDIVQTTFSKLWDNCGKVSFEKARSYLFTVANNQVLNELEKKKTVLKYHQNSGLKDYSSESPEFVLEEKEFMERIQQALESLNEGQRVAFMMNRVEGKKHEEIAEMLGISRKAVEKRIYTALAYLKERLGEKVKF
ncbi:MAG: RNA polymerase sigma factor [Bacteroidota bacterium]